MPIYYIPLLAGIPAKAEAFSEKEGYDLLELPTADVRLRVAWSQRHAAVAALIGSQYPVGSVPMYCVHVNLSTVPNTLCLNDGSGNVYAEAFLDVHYDPFTTFTESIKTNGEMIKMPRFAEVKKEDTEDETTTLLLGWRGDPDHLLADDVYLSATLEEAPSKLIVGLDYVVKFDNLDEIPEEVITCMDCVNDSTVTPVNLVGLVFEPETLMLMGSDIQHTVNVDGSVKNSLTLNFGWRKHGWNKFWRPVSRSWEYMYIIPVKESDLPIGDAVGGYTPDPDGPDPEIYRNFEPVDFGELLPEV